MPRLTSLLALPDAGHKDYEAAGLPLSGVSLAGNTGLFVAVLTLELPLLIWTYFGLLQDGIEPWQVIYLLPGRLAGIYGIIQAGRLHALFTHTWLKTPARMLTDAWWSWTLATIPMLLLLGSMFIIPEIQTRGNSETLILISTSLVWLMFLTAAPTWIWAAVRIAQVIIRIRTVTADRYRAF